MSEIPTTEPEQIIAGDTVKWTKSLDDYPADSFALNYKIVPLEGGEPIGVAATADGTDHAIAISAATSADYTAGDYRWYSYATDKATSEERYSIDSGALTIKPDPTTASVADIRSHAQKVLSAIESVLEGTASTDQAKLTIGDKSIERYSIAELLQLRSFYQAEVNQEKAAENIRKGIGSGGRFLTRFS